MHKLHNGSFRPKSRIAPPLGLMQLTRFNRKVVLLYTCKLYKGKPGNQCLALDTLHTYVNIPGHKKRFLKINSRNSFSPASFKRASWAALMQLLRSHLDRTEKASQQCFCIFPHRYSHWHPKVSPLSRMSQLSLQCCVTAMLNSNTLLGEGDREKKCTTASQVSPISGYVQDSKRTAGTLCHRLSTPNRQSTVNVG